MIAAATAFWLGILTSISPCPLATNIVAISFIGRKIDKPLYVFLTGLLYTAGRAFAYVVLGILLVNSLLSMPLLSNWLQKYMNKLLGPVLIITAMILLDMLQFSTRGGNLGRWCQQRADKFGLLGALFLGAVFALSFCRLVLWKSYTTVRQTLFRHPLSPHLRCRFGSSRICLWPLYRRRRRIAGQSLPECQPV
jgi:cytochrome c biogenesis protein CcdA